MAMLSESPRLDDIQERFWQDELWRPSGRQHGSQRDVRTIIIWCTVLGDRKGKAVYSTTAGTTATLCNNLRRVLIAGVDTVVAGVKWWHVYLCT
jgi:hypothetical protein